MSNPVQPFSPYEWYSLTPERQAAAVTELRRVRDAEQVAERDKFEAAHSAALTAATGLRRAILELHSPTPAAAHIYATIVCSCCYNPDYDDDWPCETYVLARDFPEDAE